MNIPMKLVTNEPLKQFSIGQIRIPYKEIRIPQQTLQFQSFSSKFKEGDSNPSQGDSNPSHSDSNPHFREFRLMKEIRIPYEEIRKIGRAHV